MSRDETDRLAEMTADAVIVVNEKLKGQQRKAAEAEQGRLARIMQGAEAIARFRLSPRRDRWAEIAAFDARVDELEGRHGAVMSEIAAVREQLPAVEAEYQLTLAAWHAAHGQKGDRPESTVPALTTRVQALQDDLGAIDRLIEQALQEKATFVRKYRRRLVQQAARATVEARAAYEAAIAALTSAREELRLARRDQVWASLFPHGSLVSEPPLSTVLAGGLVNRWRRAGIAQSFGLKELERLLEEDADVLATAMTREQAAELAGTDARLLGTDVHWQETEEGRKREREEKAAARRRIAQEWGSEPPEFGW